MDINNLDGRRMEHLLPASSSMLQRSAKSMTRRCMDGSDSDHPLHFCAVSYDHQGDLISFFDPSSQRRLSQHV